MYHDLTFGDCGAREMAKVEVAVDGMFTVGWRGKENRDNWGGHTARVRKMD